MVEPCVLLARRHTKRHRGKIQSVRNFAFPVIRRGSCEQRNTRRNKQHASLHNS
ncbi:Uncharacterised protein [Vibrio cholerae]|nr:Uncharacterised protein [Vibrio cholerae]